MGAAAGAVPAVILLENCAVCCTFRLPAPGSLVLCMPAHVNTPLPHNALESSQAGQALRPPPGGAAAPGLAGSPRRKMPPAAAAGLAPSTAPRAVPHSCTAPPAALPLVHSGPCLPGSQQRRPGRAAQWPAGAHKHVMAAAHMHGMQMNPCGVFCQTCVMILQASKLQDKCLQFRQALALCALFPACAALLVAVQAARQVAAARAAAAAAGPHAAAGLRQTVNGSPGAPPAAAAPTHAAACLAGLAVQHDD